MKLPTLLEGETLAVWLDLDEGEQKNYDTAKKRLVETLNYDTAKKRLVETLMPMGFTVLNKFQTRQLQLGEALSVFTHDLQKLLEQAMPDIDGKTHDQLLLHQFVAGLPLTVSKQLHAAGAVTNLRKPSKIVGVVGNGIANTCSHNGSTNSAQ